jgi:hypothetical protein
MTSVAVTPTIATRRRALAAGLVAACLATPLHAQTTPRVAVTEIKPLLALAAERGAAHGVLTGPGADYVRRRFDAAAPIEIDVRALHALPQAGCARLEVTTRQRDVLEHGQRSDQELQWQISFCRDGSFPEKR